MQTEPGSVAASAANPYEAPQARIADPAVDAGSEASFYVVSPSKFLIMAIGTFGIYIVYWFYKNWAQLNRRHKDYWPVMRAIFSIFFTHSLFGEVDQKLRRQRAPWSWSPGVLATAYVVAAIAGRVFDQISRRSENATVFDVLPLAMLGVQVFAIYRAQLAINVADGDPAGAANDKLTPANYLWLALGGLFWVVILLGLYAIAAGL
ncbi:MAG TPA: hypothetical protein VFL14_03320 [Xanthomonadales bacterium]|nr:hypothetical protein [Xanthomonadales bacterium]